MVVEVCRRRFKDRDQLWREALRDVAAGAAVQAFGLELRNVQCCYYGAGLSWHEKKRGLGDLFALCESSKDLKIYTEEQKTLWTLKKHGILDSIEP